LRSFNKRNILIRLTSKAMKQSLVLILSFLCISGCTKELKIDFDEPSERIVLYPVLTNKRNIVIKMSGPTGILSENFPILENGKVVITDNDFPVDTVIINTKGNGYSEIIPVTGHKYGFRATCSGYPEAYCVAQLPEPVEALSVDTAHLSLFPFTQKLMRARLKFKDNPNSVNYYKATIFRKGYSTSSVVTGKYPDIVIHDTTCVIISRPQLHANIPDHGFFYTSVNMFLLAQDVIDFGDGHSFRFELGSEIYFNGSEFYFSDYLFDGKEMTLNIFVDGSVLSIHPEKYIIELSAISEDYYLGLKSFARYGTKEIADLPVAEEVSIYSAVKGGYGFPVASYTVVDSTFWMQEY